ncbi:uncharacterized protein LOC111128552 isoform X1 [Crassostrea virginica]
MFLLCYIYSIFRNLAMGTSEMFRGETAWFSSSVSPRLRTMWKRNGGQMSPLDSAMFVISQDFNAPDTVQIFTSEAYLNEHLAVIHPKYISDSIASGTKTTLMSYKLPPEEVYQATKDRHVYKWDSNSEEENDPKQINKKRQTHGRRNLRGNKNAENELTAPVTKTTGTGSSRGGAENSFMRTKGQHQSGDMMKKLSEEMCHIDDIPKIAGVLEEFIPGQNGCEVFKK